ncbi:MAG: type II toxin-antitoxin system RelB/DinJ family antitoxin [bacterium]|nr:type II toxin-antitoxin system RelB/DinJ family antitoxin [bacterium]
MMTQIQIRIDERTKRDAQKVLETVGLDLSSAIKVYLKQVIIHKGIPLMLVTENGLTPFEEQAILKASAEARSGKNTKQTESWKETKVYLDSLKSKK